MKKTPFRMLSLFVLILIGISCNEPIKKDDSNEKDHPKLLKKHSYGNLSSAIQDKAGNLWFGTSDNGLYKYDGKIFQQFTEKEGLQTSKIYCLLEDQNQKLWIGTEEGLYYYDGNSFSKIALPLPEITPTNNNQNHKKQWIYSMLQDKAGTLWFATINGVFVSDGKTFEPFPIPEAANGFLTNNDKVERMIEDAAGTLWFSGRTNKGIFRFDGKKRTYLQPKELIQNENGARPKPHNWGWPQVQEKDGTIWFSNWGGAYRFDGTAFRNYGAKEGLPKEVTKIIADKKGTIWLGCSDGLRRFDGKSFTHFKEGLSNPWIWEILEDKAENLWIGTRQTGLYLFDGQKFTSYSELKK